MGNMYTDMDIYIHMYVSKLSFCAFMPFCTFDTFLQRALVYGVVVVFMFSNDSFGHNG